MAAAWLESRLQGLTARERQVLLLWTDPGLTVQDVADAIGTTTATISALRQSIRRKLNVPRGTEVIGFLREQEADLTYLFEAPAVVAPQSERRRYHVLRAAIRDLDVTARRAQARTQGLLTLADTSVDPERSALLAEAAIVEALVRDVIALRDRMIEQARADAALS